MKYEVVIAETAKLQFNGLDARWRSAFVTAMRAHLRHEPRRTRKSRIKRLRGLRRPQYRLRVGAMRVFYDVDDAARRVEVLGIIDKGEASKWLWRIGERLT